MTIADSIKTAVTRNRSASSHGRDHDPISGLDRDCATRILITTNATFRLYPAFPNMSDRPSPATVRHGGIPCLPHPYTDFVPALCLLHGSSCHDNAKSGEHESGEANGLMSAWRLAPTHLRTGRITFVFGGQSCFGLMEYTRRRCAIAALYAVTRK